jgi:hypothetical protein
MSDDGRYNINTNYVHNFFNVIFLHIHTFENNLIIFNNISYRIRHKNV